jgi:hypothetical protein
MRPIARFEEHLARWLAAPASRLLQGRLHPVQLAQHLGRAMEIEAAVGLTQTYAPDDYVVTLHPDDRVRYTGLEGTLEQELAHYLVEAAHERGLVLQRRPQVRFETDATVKRGEPRVIARFSSPTEPTAIVEEAASLKVQIRMADSSLVDVARLPWRIGRALDNDTILEDRRVSRYHVALRLMRGRLCVEDLGSTHGTRLNGERVTIAFLEPGDRLTLGSVDIHLATIERLPAAQASSASLDSLKKEGED